MVDEVIAGSETMPVGARLRRMREEQGMEVADIASRTRIPLRHLEAIEVGDYAALPSPTYALGFVRSYARAVGADVNEVARDLRVELGREAPQPKTVVPYEIVEPARVPGRLLAWTTAILAVLIIGAYGVWRSGALDGTNEAPVLAAAQNEATGPRAAAPQPQPAINRPVGGEVVLTATAPVWVNISDGGTALLKEEMAAGQRFVVPATASDPRIVTGRPEALTVTVGGQPAPALGEPAKTVRNKSLRADALMGAVAPTGQKARPTQTIG